MTPTDAPRSFYFYDLETSGIDPRWHRVMQFAGLRTDADLQELGDELCTYVKLPIDVLPDPEACRVTGLTPQRVNSEGMEEFEAFAAIDAALRVSGTCTVGFNSLRFDDEFLRFGFYRHFIDPYAREFRDGNSRWDVIDLLRATAALRPDGIVWPEQDGLPSFRLELFTAANAIDHGRAHDAMSDVRATIGTARLLRSVAPRLFEFYLGLRSKAAVLNILKPGSGQPCVHVSGRLPRQRCGLSVVLPVAVRRGNANSVIAIDLARDFEPFADLQADELREVLFSPGDHVRPGLKEIRINRCPFVAPLSVLRPADQERLGIDLTAVLAQAERLSADAGLRARLLDVFERPFEADTDDVDTQLYAGFFSDVDRDRSARLQASIGRGERPLETPPFDDSRLAELLFRLRARRHADDMPLTSEEESHWRVDVAEKLRSPLGGLGLEQYRRGVAELAQEPGKEALARELGAYADTLVAWLERDAADG
jgi:exodeoxyribonuclease-1